MRTLDHQSEPANVSYVLLQELKARASLADTGVRSCCFVLLVIRFEGTDQLAMSGPTMRIAMLNTDIPVPNVHARLGLYGDIFHTLLSAAAGRVAPHITIQSTNYDVLRKEYPLDLSDVDCILITGSSASAYEDQEWIHQLEEFVIDVYNNHPHVKIFGSCFGHQLVCQCLLRNCGAFVEKDPQGWELGVRSIVLSESFRKQFSSRLPKNLQLQFVHSDHVRLPSREVLPSPWISVGSTEHCAVQGVYEKGRVMTLQGHFEFDRFVNSETLKIFGASWDPEVLSASLTAVDKDDDAEKAAEMVLMFLANEATSKASAGVDRVKGLLTPPLQD